MQTCIWTSWCHCRSLSLASVKSRFVITFLASAHPGSPGQRAAKWACVCVLPRYENGSRYVGSKKCKTYRRPAKVSRTIEWLTKAQPSAPYVTKVVSTSSWTRDSRATSGSSTAHRVQCIGRVSLSRTPSPPYRTLIVAVTPISITWHRRSAVARLSSK